MVSQCEFAQMCGGSSGRRNVTEKMNLLYLIAMYGPQYLASVVHRDLGHQFQARGHTFSVFTLASQKDLGSRVSSTVEENIPVHRAAAAGSLDLEILNAATTPLFKYSRFAAGLAAYARYTRSHPEIDLVLAEGAYPFGAIAALGSLVSHKPFVITVAGGDFIASREAQYGYGRFVIGRELTRWALSRASAIRVTTLLVRENAIRLAGASDKISLVPRNLANYSYLEPGTPPEEFREAARQALRTRYSLGEGPLLLCAGRLLPIKGFDDAIRAVKLIRASFPGVHLLVVGPDRVADGGSYQSELHTLAAQLEVGTAVTFAGTIPHEDIRTVLAGADLLLVPSLLEGMNRTVLEAAAVATPAIVSRTAGISDSATRAGSAVMIEPRSPSELASVACNLLMEGERRAAMGRSGLIFAQRFTSERIGAELIELCDWALRAHGRNRRSLDGVPSFEL
jgi:glycosyltransferase involved in cell wall biosynthesis